MSSKPRTSRTSRTNAGQSRCAWPKTANKTANIGGQDREQADLDVRGLGRHCSRSRPADATPGRTQQPSDLLFRATVRSVRDVRGFQHIGVARSKVRDAIGRAA